MAYVMPQKAKRKSELSNELDRALKAIMALKPRKVILFGSMVRDDIGSESDIDLLIVWESDMPFFKRLELFYNAINPNVAMDVLVYTPDEINEAVDTNSFIRQALKEGVILYEEQP